jgi:PST family polysaccharide transporter
MQLDPARLHRTVMEGTRWLLLPLGFAFVAFVWSSPVLVPLVFGTEWTPVLSVLPFVAFGSLAEALVSLQGSALYVLRRYLDVAGVNLLHVTLFGLAAWFLVPRIGVIGYGFGEVAGSLAYLLLHVRYTRWVQRPSYRVSGVWWGAFGAACFAEMVGWWMALPLLGVVCSPGFWREVRTLVGRWSEGWGRPMGRLK